MLLRHNCHNVLPLILNALFMYAFIYLSRDGGGHRQSMDSNWADQLRDVEQIDGVPSIEFNNLELISNNFDSEELRRRVTDDVRAECCTSALSACCGRPWIGQRRRASRASVAVSAVTRTHTTLSHLVTAKSRPVPPCPTL